jgi:formylglycine-generating enzyme required for sulfatase activity
MKLYRDVGNITVVSMPPELSVTIDGEIKGKTPLKINNYPAGTFYIKIGSISGKFELKKNQTLRLRAESGKIRDLNWEEEQEKIIQAQNEERRLAEVERQNELRRQEEQRRKEEEEERKRLEAERKRKDEENYLQSLKNDIIYVKGGSVRRVSSEKTYWVKVNDFYISKYEVTYNRYDEFCRSTNREKPKDRWGRGNRPVQYVNWFDAIAFCNWRSKKEGKEPCYTIDGRNIECNFNANGYRLPTEAEWELAARNGINEGGFSKSDLNKVAWWEENSGGTTHLVGKKEPTKIGLYDIFGNVCEWCWDRDKEGLNYYYNCPSDNPKGPTRGGRRVLKGGDYGDSRKRMWWSFRQVYFPSSRSDVGGFGFRVARSFK